MNITEVDKSEQELLKFVGERIRQRREELGLTQEAFAYKVGLHRNYVGKLERGENNFSFLVFTRLAHSLEMTPADFVTWILQGIVYF